MEKLILSIEKLEEKYGSSSTPILNRVKDILLNKKQKNKKKIVNKIICVCFKDDLTKN